MIQSYTQRKMNIQQINQLYEEGVSEKSIRIFICSNINEIFGTNIKMQLRLKGKLYWDNWARKIIIEYPKLYKLLCILRINKIYAKIIGR